MDELDELDELYELDSLSDSDEKEDNKIIQSIQFKIEILKLKNSFIPAFYTDKKLHTIWMNKATEEYIGTKVNTHSLSLQQIFSPFLNKDRMTEIKKDILSPSLGFSWTGNVELSSYDRVTARANLILIPYFGRNSKIPLGYFGIMNDITETTKTLLMNTFNALLEASKLKDNDTGHHIQRVNEYSGKIAEFLYSSRKYKEIDRQFVANIKYLAAMHDVGKIGTPDSILNKQGKLEPDEWEIMKEHAINGALILSSYPDKMAMEIARSHHEKWDGSGYPYGLAGEDIPIAARIVTIADVYDALRMERQYKKQIPHDEAIKMIESLKGKQFDPAILDVFLKIEKEIEKVFQFL